MRFLHDGSGSAIRHPQKPGLETKSRLIEEARSRLLRNRVSSENLDLWMRLRQKPGFSVLRGTRSRLLRNRVSSENLDLWMRLRQKPGFSVLRGTRSRSWETGFLQKTWTYGWASDRNPVSWGPQRRDRAESKPSFSRNKALPCPYRGGKESIMLLCVKPGLEKKSGLID
jgi:hypothetical protein